MLTTVSAGVIIAVFYSKKAVTKKVRQLMYTESRGCCDPDNRDYQVTIASELVCRMKFNFE